MKKKILQITPHLGGGLGRVIINWIRSDNNKNNNIHTIACLEKTINATEDFSDLKNYLFDDLYNQQEKLRKLISDSDIVVINWYNHPLIYDILLNLKFPECRLICYNHVSSLNPPYNMPKSLFDFFDKIVFTTNATYEADIMHKLDEEILKKCCTIESAFGTEKYIDKYPFITKKTDSSPDNNNVFNVGYFGTSSYSKLDKNFVSLCKNVNIDNIKFIVASGDSQDHIKEDAIRLNVLDKFEFKGRLPEIAPLLQESHVFGYPLQPNHLGSAEQVFGEMMVFGTVPVAMNNPAERYILNGKNGVLANNYDEYSKAIEYLYKNPDIRNQMALNAHLFAKERYSINRKINKWNSVFEEIIEISKKERFWKSNTTYTFDRGSNLFINSIGEISCHFENYIKQMDVSSEKNIKKLYNSNDQWFSNNKGGVKQYLKYFNDDLFLREWEKLLGE